MVHRRITRSVSNSGNFSVFPKEEYKVLHYFHGLISFDVVTCMISYLQNRGVSDHLTHCNTAGGVREGALGPEVANGAPVHAHPEVRGEISSLPKC